MRYRGEKASIFLGRGGLMTDMPPSDIPPSHLIDAKDIIVQDGTIQKGWGVRRWNASALSTGICDLFQWQATEARSYVYVLTKGGTIHRFVNREESLQLSAVSTADPSTLVITGNDGFFVEGGEESPGNSRKLFVFSKNNQIQVITADGTTYKNIATPSADFSTSNYPRAGIIHQGRLWVWLPHRVYASTPNNHEDFTGSGSLQLSLFPGEGLFTLSAFIFNKQLFFFKKGQGGGFYQLIDSDPSTSNWYIQKVTSEFSIGAHNAIAEAANDLFAVNDGGTVTSLAATEKFGSVDRGDTFNILKVKRFFDQMTSNTGVEDRRVIYDKKKQDLIIAYKPASAIKNNALWRINFSQDAPQITYSEKEQANCLRLLSIPTGVEKPFYGADDGFIYELNCEDREIGLVYNPVAPLAALGTSSGSLDNATYRFRVEFYDDTDQSLWSAPTEEVTITDNSVIGRIELTFIPVDTTNTATKRRIFGKKSTDTSWKLVGTISDNVTTSFTVNSDPSTWTVTSEPSLNTFNNPYSMTFQVPHLTMEHQNPLYKGMNKNFEFFEIGFISTKLNDITLEYWIDGIYKRSRTFQTAKGPILGDGSLNSTAYQFKLNTDRLSTKATRWVHFKLHGSGRSISFRFSNGGQKENAIITDVNCYFKVSNEDRRAIKSGKLAG